MSAQQLAAILESLRTEAMYVAERITMHYREGIAYEVGWINLPAAQSNIEKMIVGAMEMALTKHGVLTGGAA